MSKKTLAALDRAIVRWAKAMHLVKPRCRCPECALIRACNARAKSLKGKR